MRRYLSVFPPLRPFYADRLFYKQVAETYTTALATIAPRKATSPLNTLYTAFAKFYENGGVKGEAVHDIHSARRVFEGAIKVGYKSVEELAEVWCEWAEMELRNE